eukprot:COSAG06_NODE_1345_length_9785_cov_2.721557_4_plen_285_part_00
MGHTRASQLADLGYCTGPYHGPSAMMIRPLACALLLELATSQQLVIPGVSDGGGCDLETLSGRVHQVDDLCCFETSGNPGARCAGGVSCDVPCAEKLLPFLSNCHPLIDKIFDADDGSYDGIAGQFDSVYGACMAIDPAEALAALSDLKDSGQCTDAQLDGVAETPVSAAPCVDVRHGCPNLIASGFMTCVADFGPTGDMPGQCDMTCAFCDGPPPPPEACDDMRDGCSMKAARPVKAWLPAGRDGDVEPGLRMLDHSRGNTVTLSVCAERQSFAAMESRPLRP